MVSEKCYKVSVVAMNCIGILGMVIVIAYKLANEDLL